LFAAILLILSIAGCSDDNSNQSGSGNTAEALELAKPQAVNVAKDVDTKDFPQADGKKTLDELMGEVAASRDLAMAPGAQEFVQGRENRLPFGLFTTERKAVWAPTVVYLAKDAKSPASGPFPAPAISLDVPEEFRAENANAKYGDPSNGIYVANVDAPADAKQLQVMTLTNIDEKFHATRQSLGFREKPSTPDIGDKAPVYDNRTLEDVGGESGLKQIETRIPPDSMHEISLRSALKQDKPVVLVFATPLHCVSRVCGPVTDVAEYLNSKYSDKAAFIHQEIYNNNIVKAGYTLGVSKYRLPTEPYTFVIGSDGRIAAKFEGPTTIPELEAAVQKATDGS
jgi:hypothetical protein